MVEEIQENYRKNDAGLCVFDWVYFKEAGQNNSIYLLIETDDKLSPLNGENEFKQPDYIMKAKAKPPGHAGKKTEEMSSADHFYLCVKMK